jgi:hypothetical protein
MKTNTKSEGFSGKVPVIFGIAFITPSDAQS